MWVKIHSIFISSFNTSLNTTDNMTQKSPYVHLKHKWIHSNQFSITYKYPSVCLFSSINKYSPKHYQQHTSEATLCQSLASIHPKRSRGNITHKSPYIYNKQTRQITCITSEATACPLGPVTWKWAVWSDDMGMRTYHRPGRPMGLYTVTMNWKQNVRQSVCIFIFHSKFILQCLKEKSPSWKNVLSIIYLSLLTPPPPFFFFSLLFSPLPPSTQSSTSLSFPAPPPSCPVP